MRTPDIKALADTMMKARVNVLEIDEGGRRLRLVMTLAQPAALPAAPVAPGKRDNAVIKAGTVGLFRRAHPAKHGPEVKDGDQVQQGGIVGFLEIGPILLPVTAPRSGLIGRTLAEDGALVGFGTPLFEFAA